MGHLWPGPERRCHPLTVLDDHSRYTVLQACGNEQGQTVQERLTQTFRRYGDAGVDVDGQRVALGRRSRESVDTVDGVAVAAGSEGYSRASVPSANAREYERFHRTLVAEVLQGRVCFAICRSATVEGSPYVWHFFDLDIGHQLPWPAQIPKDEAKIDWQQLADWAADSGADLMCITHRAKDGTETYVLRTLGVKAWEIGPRDLRNIDRLIAAGTLPEGREVGELLIHYDAQSQQLVPDANGAFLFITREGNMGLIETTERVAGAKNPAGPGGSPPPASSPGGGSPGGAGFHSGVRFNLKPIIP